MSILSNKVIRWLSNIIHKRQDKVETKLVVEHFTKELKVTGYTRAEAKEIVVSGLVEWKMKMSRREKEGEIYRSARSTLGTSCKKHTWYQVQEAHLVLGGRRNLSRRQAGIRRRGKGWRRMRRKESKSMVNIAFARGGAHLPIAHALRLLSTQELRFGLTKLNSNSPGSYIRLKPRYMKEVSRIAGITCKIAGLYP